MYMICLTYCFHFFSVIATLFDVASCIFKLKDFNSSNSFVLLLLIKLGHLGHGLTSHKKIVKRCLNTLIIFLDMTLLISVLTHFKFVSVLSNYIASYDTHSLPFVFITLSQLSCFFLYKCK